MSANDSGRGDMPRPASLLSESATSTRRRRRKMAMSALFTLVLSVPWLLASLMVAYLVGLLIGGSLAAVLLVIWLMSGTAVFIRSVEKIAISRFMGLRSPTRSENETIQSAWQVVANTAGANPAGYLLMVDDEPGINAMATAGHLVAVTRHTLVSVPPQHLVGILAHEFGHHLGGAPWVRTLMLWYSLPGRLAVAVLRRCGRVATFLIRWWVRTFLVFLPRRGVDGLIDGIAFLIMSVLVVVAVATQLWVLLPLYALPSMLAFASRREEMRADREAVRLGFGRELISALELLQRIEDNLAGDDEHHARKGGWRHRMLSSHPPLNRRIRSLETLVEGRCQ